MDPIRPISDALPKVTAVQRVRRRRREQDDAPEREAPAPPEREVPAPPERPQPNEQEGDRVDLRA